MSREGGNPGLAYSSKAVTFDPTSPFHGGLAAGHTIRTERPVHRRMQDLAMQGLTTKEISQVVGRSKKTVTQTLRQPFAQERMARTMKEDAHAELRKMIEQAAGPSFRRLVEVAEDETFRMKDPKGFAEVNKSIVERFLGKAAQPLEHSYTNPDQMTTAELEAIARKGQDQLDAIDESNPSRSS